MSSVGSSHAVVVEEKLVQSQSLRFLKNRLIELVVRERSLDPDTAVFSVVPDGGGGTFKVMVFVFDGNCDPEIPFKTNEVLGKLNTGVDRLLPLAVVENCPERHHNLHKILSHLKLQDVNNLFIVGDLKIYNVMLGISSHGGKYACAFCLGTSTLDSGIDRTFGHLEDHYSSYRKAGVNKKRLQNFYITINECLIVVKREERALD